MTINELSKTIKRYKSALIFCHQRPDGDTLSCAFALKKAIERSGGRADVVCSDPVPEKYSATGFFGETFTDAKSGYDGYIAVDCASSDMLGKNENFFLKQKETLVIDHHGTNTGFAAKNYVDLKSACAVNIFFLIKELGVEIDRELAEMILLGIVTDTGNFAHSNTDPLSLKIAAELMEKGADLNLINRLMFNSQKKSRAELFLKVMSETRFFYNDRFAIIYTSKKDLEEYSLDRAETEGFVDFPMSIGSVEVCAALTDAGKNGYKISLRSKNINVAEIAGFFGGGGHKNAGGCMLFGFFEDVLDKLVFTVGNYLEH